METSSFMSVKLVSSSTCYTNNECLWVQWCEYVHELKDGMFFLFNEAEPSLMEHSSFQRYLHYCTNEKHSLFVLYNIQVDLCHFDWKIQLSKQTECRPTIFNCEITPVSLLVGLLDSTVTMCVLYSYYETRRSRMLVMLLIIMTCSNTAVLPKTRVRSDVFNQLLLFNPKRPIARWQCNGTFKWNGKAWWVTQRAMVLLFAITWRTILQSNGKDLLGCYIIAARHWQSGRSATELKSVF